MPPRKRRAPNTPEASGRRRSQRIPSSGKKSQYFEADSENSSNDEEGSRPSKRARAAGVRRAYGGQKAPKADTDDEEAYKEDESEEADNDGSDDTADEEEEEVRPAVKAKMGASATRQVKKKNASDEEDEDEDEEPRVTFIPHKKMRDIGAVEYEDDKIHKNTMLFLKDLKANNKRSWLKGTQRGLQIHDALLCV